MQQSGTNKISLIVNNHIHKYQINGPSLPCPGNSRNVKPPLQRGDSLLGGLFVKKPHSLSIHHNSIMVMNHLKLVSTHKKTKNTSHHNLSIHNNHNNSISSNSVVNNNGPSNCNINGLNSLARPPSPFGGGGLRTNIIDHHHSIQKGVFSFRNN